MRDSGRGAAANLLPSPAWVDESTTGEFPFSIQSVGVSSHLNVNGPRKARHRVLGSAVLQQQNDL